MTAIGFPNPSKWLGLSVALLVAMPQAARAQSGVVAGTVIAGASQRPLAGVQISVEAE